MTVAALPSGAAHVAPLPLGCGEHADVMGRLAEKAKEDVVVALLGALRSVAVACSVCVQRLQVLQEEAAAGGGQVLQTCSQDPSLPDATKQAEEFLLEDGEDCNTAAASCAYDLEAVYELMNSPDLRQAVALAGGDRTVEEVLERAGSAWEAAVPAAETHSSPAAPGAAVAVDEDAAKAAAVDVADVATSLPATCAAVAMDADDADSADADAADVAGPASEAAMPAAQATSLPTTPCAIVAMDADNAHSADADAADVAAMPAAQAPSLPAAPCAVVAMNADDSDDAAADVADVAAMPAAQATSLPATPCAVVAMDADDAHPHSADADAADVAAMPAAQAPSLPAAPCAVVAMNADDSDDAAADAADVAGPAVAAAMPAAQATSLPATPCAVVAMDADDAHAHSADADAVDVAAMPAAQAPSLPAAPCAVVAMDADDSDDAAADAADVAVMPAAQELSLLAAPCAIVAMDADDSDVAAADAADVAVCARCGFSSSEKPGPERSCLPVWAGCQEDGWFCYGCLALRHREQGNDSAALLHDLWDQHLSKSLRLRERAGAGPRPRALPAPRAGAAAEAAGRPGGGEEASAAAPQAAAASRPPAAAGRPPAAEAEAAAEASASEAGAAAPEREAAAGEARTAAAEVASGEARTAAEETDEAFAADEALATSAAAWLVALSGSADEEAAAWDAGAPADATAAWWQDEGGGGGAEEAEAEAAAWDTGEPADATAAWWQDEGAEGLGEAQSEAAAWDAGAPADATAAWWQDEGAGGLGEAESEAAAEASAAAANLDWWLGLPSGAEAMAFRLEEEAAADGAGWPEEGRGGAGEEGPEVSAGAAAAWLLEDGGGAREAEAEACHSNVQLLEDAALQETLCTEELGEAHPSNLQLLEGTATQEATCIDEWREATSTASQLPVEPAATDTDAEAAAQKFELEDEVEAEEAAEDAPAVDIPEALPWAEGAAGAERYYVICYAKDWKSELPMRPVSPCAARPYDKVGGPWLAHRLAFLPNRLKSRFQIVGGARSRPPRAIWVGAVRDEFGQPPMGTEPADASQAWPVLEVGGSALPTKRRTSEQQLLKGLDWIAHRPAGGSVVILYNPEQELILCRLAEDVEELRDEAGESLEEPLQPRAPGFYVARGSEDWVLPDDQGPMAQEVDSDGEHQLVQVLSLPPSCSSERLRILRDGRADERLAPLSDDPDGHLLSPNGTERAGQHCADQRECPHQDWLLQAAEGATVRIVWRAQAGTILCEPWGERKQARAPRWEALAARGGGATGVDEGDALAVDVASADGAASGRPVEGPGEEQQLLEENKESGELEAGRYPELAGEWRPIRTEEWDKPKEANHPLTMEIWDCNGNGRFVNGPEPDESGTLQVMSMHNRLYSVKWAIPLKGLTGDFHMNLFADGTKMYHEYRRYYKRTEARAPRWEALATRGGGAAGEGDALAVDVATADGAASGPVQGPGEEQQPLEEKKESGEVEAGRYPELAGEWRPIRTEEWNSPEEANHPLTMVTWDCNGNGCFVVGPDIGTGSGTLQVMSMHDGQYSVKWTRPQKGSGDLAMLLLADGTQMYHYPLKYLKRTKAPSLKCHDRQLEQALAPRWEALAARGGGATGVGEDGALAVDVASADGAASGRPVEGPGEEQQPLEERKESGEVEAGLYPELAGEWRPFRTGEWKDVKEANDPRTLESWDCNGNGSFIDGDNMRGQLKVISVSDGMYNVEYTLEPSGKTGSLRICFLSRDTRRCDSPKRYLKRTEALKCHYAQLEQECLGSLAAGHAAQGPRSRRGSSWPRTLAYGKVKLGASSVPLREASHSEPFRIWVLGATDQVEGSLLAEGFWEDANLAGRAPTEVLLLGEQLQDWGTDFLPGVGDGAISSCMSYEDLCSNIRLGQALPDMVAVLMPGADGQGLPPEEVLQALQEVPAVVSMRFKLDENRLLELKQKMPRGRLLWKPTPCPFSSCPEGSASAFADNGWIMAAQGPDALKWLWTLAAPRTIPPGEPRPKAELQPACFWGILDIKYDTARPVLERVQVLETGDGKTSKFSGDGADLRRRYLEKYKSQEDSAHAMLEVIAADKKLTHDFSVDHEYGHVLPRQVCFERRYKADLWTDIASGLGLRNPEDLVVLKLCNRTRGAGVVVTPVSTLDEMLRELLQQPPNLEAWFAKHAATAMRSSGSRHLDLGLRQAGSFEEQKRHWWSNECPVFVAEACASSLSIQRNGEHFDGTLRAGFALRRRRPAGPAPPEEGQAEGEPSSSSTSSSSSSSCAEEFEIDWLGCYWKLPKKPRSTSGAADIRDSIVSAARTSGTAPVHPAQCQEVYAALGDLVPRLFCTPEFRKADLVTRYNRHPGLPAYLLACLAASGKRAKSERQKAEDLLYEALAMLKAERDQAKGEPVSAGVRWASSYVHRQLCGVLARSKSGPDWGRDMTHHREVSLEFMPTNASSLYIAGTALLQSGKPQEAETLLLRSLLLDPDFKLVYVQLGICYLRQTKYEQVISTSEAGLERTPLAQFNYHLGLAHAQLAMHTLTYRVHMLHSNEFRDEARRALDYLLAARQSQEARKQSKGQPPWTQQDARLVNLLQRVQEGQALAPEWRDMKDFKDWPKLGWPATSNRI